MKKQAPWQSSQSHDWPPEKKNLVSVVIFEIAIVQCLKRLQILELPFIVTSLRHTWAIIMLFNQHLYMLHLSGGWINLAKEKCSLTH